MLRTRGHPKIICFLIIIAFFLLFIPTTKVNAAPINEIHSFIIDWKGGSGTIEYRYLIDDEVGYMAKVGNMGLVASHIRPANDGFCPFAFSQWDNGNGTTTVTISGDYSQCTPYLVITANKYGYNCTGFKDFTWGGKMWSYQTGGFLSQAAFLVDAGIYYGDWVNHSDDWNWDHARRPNGDVTAVAPDWSPVPCWSVPKQEKAETDANVWSNPASNELMNSSLSRQYNFDGGIHLPGAMFTKTGYTQNGWYFVNAQNQIGFYGLNQVMPNDHIVYWNQNGCWGRFFIYPTWQANTYTVRYHGNGATSGSMADTACTYDQNIALRGNTFARTGYHFLGWSTSPGGGVVYSNGQTVRNLTSTNDGVINLYAVWGNNPPTITKWESREIGTNTLNNGSWSNKGYNITLNGSDDHGIIRSTIGSNSWYENALNVSRNANYTAEGEFSVGGSITDNANVTTKTNSNITVRIDKTKPTIASFGVRYGTQANPIGATSSNIIATSPGGIPVYNDYDTGVLRTPYGSLISWNVYDPKAANVNKVSGVRQIYLKIYDATNPSNTKTYPLNGLSGSVDIDTVTDFNNCMCLTYELHVIDNAGNENVSTKTVERPIELYTSIEKTIKDGNDTFEGGTTGILHIYTTGWVDNVNMVFPMNFYQSWEYDKTKNYPSMNPTANDVFVFKDNDPNVNTYPLSDFPSNIVPTDYTTYGRNDFIRCYDFYFWVPLTINDADNPAAVTEENTTWLETTIARKHYERVNGQGRQATVSVVNSTAMMNGHKGKITDHFKTTIKSVN